MTHTYGHSDFETESAQWANSVKFILYFLELSLHFELFKQHTLCKTLKTEHLVFHTTHYTLHTTHYTLLKVDVSHGKDSLATNNKVDTLDIAVESVQNTLNTVLDSKTCTLHIIKHQMFTVNCTAQCPISQPWEYITSSPFPPITSLLFLTRPI